MTSYAKHFVTTVVFKSEVSQRLVLTCKSSYILTSKQSIKSSFERVAQYVQVK